MSCSLPPEILDLIIDLLRDEPAALKACCVVSKSWVPQTRKHLFAHVRFSAAGSHVELWKGTFPDPSNSPAHHTRSLSIYDLPSLTAAGGDVVSGLIRTFGNVADLHLFGRGHSQFSLAPLSHGSLPAVRSLCLAHTSLEVLDIICAFPLLEDLVLDSLSCWPDADVWNPSSTSPKLTGTLDLRAITIRSAVRRLVDLLDGFHFTKIMVECETEDVESTMDLVSRCSDTLESLRIHFYFPGAFISAPMRGQYLTAICRRRHDVRGTFARPLQGHKTQRCGVSV
jgi:hypothetical protein